ncbi:MAG: hypothetical protein WBC22_04085 [Sedimentisphaerales bacterium]
MTNKAPFCASLRPTRTVFSRLKTYMISVNPVILSIFSSCLRALRGEKIRKISVNPWLINDLRSTKDYVRKNKLFMQNKANFRKVKLNVNKVLTRDYEQKDTWSIGKTKPIKANSKPIKANSKPIKANSKPIKANIMPKQSQYKPKQTQFQSQKMKITGRHKPFAYEAGTNGIDKTNCILSTNLVIISKYTRSNKMKLSENCCPDFNEGVNLCMETK